MVDENSEVKEILETINGVTVTFYHPEKFNKLPIISYYNLGTTTGLCYDDQEQGQDSNVSIDIWGRSGAECGRLAITVDKVMQSQGWLREMSRDMPKETEGKTEVYHKAMRFFKHIFFN